MIDNGRAGFRNRRIRTAKGGDLKQRHGRASPQLHSRDGDNPEVSEVSELRYNRLGQTDLQVSAVSLGTSPIGDMFGPVEEADSIAVVRHALDAGINFFDSSPITGEVWPSGAWEAR